MIFRERRPPPLCLMGLTEAELRILAAEGAATDRRFNMDWLMKLMMGGWIPVEKRTQWTAFGMAITTIVTTFFQMGTGEASAQMFLQMLAEQWEVFVAAYGLYFLGEKVDKAKSEVKEVKAVIEDVK